MPCHKPSTGQYCAQSLPTARQWQGVPSQPLPNKLLSSVTCSQNDTVCTTVYMYVGGLLFEKSLTYIVPKLLPPSPQMSTFLLQPHVFVGGVKRLGSRACFDSKCVVLPTVHSTPLDAYICMYMHVHVHWMHVHCCLVCTRTSMFICRLSLTQFISTLMSCDSCHVTHVI